MSGKLRIYGTGGTGINIAGHFDGTTAEPNCAQIETCYIDTSRSNLKEHYGEDNIFLLEDVDGSGKIRKENHREISNSIKQMVLEFKPEDLNVVVFSASGGSGSVIGPLIIAELLEKKETVIALVVGSDESIITTNNTLNTFKSLEAIAKKQQAPVTMFYEQNRGKRGDVDDRMRLAISALTILGSGKNEELDSKDIFNWAYFNKSTTVEPCLALLEIFDSSEEAGKIEDPISIASIYTDTNSAPLNIVPEYHAAGYLAKGSDTLGSVNELHFIITIDAIGNIIKSVKSTLEDQEMKRESRVRQESFLSDSDVISDDGLVL